MLMQWLYAGPSLLPCNFSRARANADCPEPASIRTLRLPLTSFQTDELQVIGIDRASLASNPVVRRGTQCRCLIE